MIRYFLGGPNGPPSDKQSNIIYYDMNTDEWNINVAVLETFKQKTTCFLYEKTIYIFGGVSRKNDVSITGPNIVQTYNPLTNVVKVLPLVPLKVFAWNAYWFFYKTTFVQMDESEAFFCDLSIKESEQFCLEINMYKPNLFNAAFTYDGLHLFLVGGNDANNKDSTTPVIRKIRVADIINGRAPHWKSHTSMPDDGRPHIFHVFSKVAITIKI